MKTNFVMMLEMKTVEESLQSETGSLPQSFQKTQSNNTTKTKPDVYCDECNS